MTVKKTGRGGKTSGSWKKGQCGNPKGGPTKEAVRAKNALREALWSNEDVKSVAQRLLNIALTGSDNEAISAAKEIFNRTFGRAKEPVTVNYDKEAEALDMPTLYAVLDRYVRESGEAPSVEH